MPSSISPQTLDFLKIVSKLLELNANRKEQDRGLSKGRSAMERQKKRARDEFCVALIELGSRSVGQDRVKVEVRGGSEWAEGNSGSGSSDFRWFTQQPEKREKRVTGTRAGKGRSEYNGGTERWGRSVLVGDHHSQSGRVLVSMSQSNLLFCQS